MRRIGKGFSRVDTPLFDGMLVQQQVQDVEDAAEDEDDDNKVSAEPTPPSLTPATTSPPYQPKPIPSPPQAETAQLSSPPPQQPSQNADVSQSAMALLNTLRMHPNEGGIAELDADEEVTLEDIDAEVAMDADDTDEAEPAKVKEVIEVTATKLMTDVVTIAATTITAAQVPKVSASRRRKGVVVTT
nr:hypothetical protein [Tanacetum cinerariifolium]